MAKAKVAVKGKHSKNPPTVQVHFVTNVADVIDEEAARLAGVAQILRLLIENETHGDAIAVCEDVVASVNKAISTVAANLRHHDGEVTHG